MATVITMDPLALPALRQHLSNLFKIIAAGSKKDELATIEKRKEQAVAYVAEACYQNKREVLRAVVNELERESVKFGGVISRPKEVKRILEEA